MIDSIVATFQAMPTNEIVGLVIVGILMLAMSLSASKSMSETTNGVKVELTIENNTPGRIVKLFWLVLVFIIPVWYVVVIQVIMIYLILTNVTKAPYNEWLMSFQPSDEEVKKGLEKLKGAQLSDLARNMKIQ